MFDVMYIYKPAPSFLPSHLLVEDGNCDEPPEWEEVNIEIEGHLQWQTGKDFTICTERKKILSCLLVNMTVGYRSILASRRAVISLFPVKLNVKKDIFIYLEEIFTPYLELHH